MTNALSTEGRAADRLAAALMGWLTTVRADGMPQSSAVWFVAHDGAIYVLRTTPDAMVGEYRETIRITAERTRSW